MHQLISKFTKGCCLTLFLKCILWKNRFCRKLLADLYRMNYDQKKSKYGDTAKDVDAALKLIKEEAKIFVDSRLKSE